MKYEQWNLRAGGTETARREMELAGMPPLCAAVLCARGLDTAEKAAAFLASDPGLLHDPFLLRDMGAAVARIEQALKGGQTVAVYGDYDVDGITSTCLLTEFLREQGGRVVSYIPDRIEEGYGLNRHAIDRLAAQGVKLIVTVDCGITATEEVEYARSVGMDVVITDHHHCKNDLPAAVAVVDPRRADCEYPFKELAGVGVALKLALALTPEHRRELVLRRYVELAAIGTVSDVMRLTDENRAIVRMGLSRLTRTRRPGLRALIQEVAPNHAKLTAVNIGYGLAPRINAAGRMEQAGVALELLLTRDETRGHFLSQKLCELNRERQAIELAIYEECSATLARSPHLAGPAIVMAGEGWHQGVVGIVASRLAERHSCPAFMICLDRGKGKGSCRSFGGFNLFAALESCAHLLEGYGGHELAAGFTILEENIPAFKAAMDALVADYACAAPMISSIDVDVDIDDSALLTVQQVDALSLLEPFGAGNPKPVFRLKGALVLSCSDVGGGRHLKMRVRREGHIFDAIFFSANSAAAGVSAGDRVDLVFTPQINEYRGRRDLQLQLCDLRPAPTRAQAEQALFDKLCAGTPLTPREAASILPSREDFTYLWRFLQRTCAAGPAAGPMDRLARSAIRSASGHRSFGRTMVCLQVMDERGLIRVEHTHNHVSVTIHTPAEKVDLEQSRWMKLLRDYMAH